MGTNLLFLLLSRKGSEEGIVYYKFLLSVYKVPVLEELMRDWTRMDKDEKDERTRMTLLHKKDR